MGQQLSCACLSKTKDKGAPCWSGLDYFYQELTRLQLPFFKSEANFVLFDTKRNVDEVNLNLLKKGIILRPVQNYGFKTLIRMTVGLPEENLSNSLAVSRHLLRWLCFLLQASISPR